MARLPRLVVPNQPHYVIQRGNDQQTIFRDAEDYAAFLSWLRSAAKHFGVAIHAYALMPNQLHLLLSPSDASGLGRTMQWTGRHYVPFFNAKYQRTGTLWAGRYKTAVIESEQYFFACSRYIELLPVAASCAAAATEYRWSSAAHHVGAVQDPVITEHALYWALGNTPFQREAAYRAALEQGLSAKEAAALDDAAGKGWALGSDNFKALLSAQVDRRVAPGKRGRPRKASTSANPSG